MEHKKFMQINNNNQINFKGAFRISKKLDPAVAAKFENVMDIFIKQEKTVHLGNEEYKCYWIDDQIIEELAEKFCKENKVPRAYEESEIKTKEKFDQFCTCGMASNIPT